MQYIEGLSDQEAAEAVRCRLDWKYLLGLELRRLSRNMVYVDGNPKLANPLVNLGVASYTEQWSVSAPAGVLM
jgi:Transposase domain (DUF772)